MRRPLSCKKYGLCETLLAAVDVTRSSTLGACLHHDAGPSSVGAAHSNIAELPSQGEVRFVAPIGEKARSFITVGGAQST